MADFRGFDLNLLLTFDCLMEEKTITKAAERLQVSQPTVSVSLNKLRTALGDELFVRSAGTMQPTARAMDLRDPVRRIIEAIRSDVLEYADFDPIGYRGTFTLSLSDIGEMEFIPKLLKAFQTAAPNATMQSVVADPYHLSSALDAGEIDLAMGYFPDLTASGFKQQLLFMHPFACVARKNHPEIAGRITMEQFLNATHVVVVQPGRKQDLFERALAEQGIARRVALKVPHFISVPYLIAETDLIATVPRPLATTFAVTCDLQVLEPPMDSPLIEVKQVWHRRFDRSPRLIWLRSLVSSISQNKPHL